MTDKQRIIEIIAVVITGVGKFVFVDLIEQKLIFIIAAITFWVAYSIFRMRRTKGVLKYWGLSLENINPTLRIVGITGLIMASLFIAYGIIVNQTSWSINILWVLLTYPIWGLIQQFLVMSLFAGNLMDMQKIKINYYVILSLTCIMFSLVHYPSTMLMIATFFMAIFYSIIFLKYRNIIPLGIFHGIMGGLFYYFVLNRDPWLEMMTVMNK